MCVAGFNSMSVSVTVISDCQLISIFVFGLFSMSSLNSGGFVTDSSIIRSLERGGVRTVSEPSQAQIDR